MAESYSVQAVLSAVDKNFSSVMGGAVKSTGLISKAISGIGFGAMMAVGSKAMSVIGSGVSGLISNMNEASSTWQTFNSSMEMNGKTPDQIKSIKKELQSFAEQTIYSSSDMASTFAQLDAVGTKNTTQLVKGFGGLAAAAENPTQAMKTLSQQATQMAAKPKVAWEDFKLILEQTPAGVAAIAKGMGKSTSELISGVQAGNVSTEEFFDTITKVGTNDAFTKLATKYKTTGQAMDGLKETMSNKLLPIFEDFSKKGIKSISGITDTLSKVDFEGIYKKVKSTFSPINDIVNITKDTFSSFGRMAGKIIDKFFGGKKANVFDNLSKSVKGFLDFIANMGLDNLEKLWNFEDSDAFKGILDSAQQFGNFVSKSLVPMISQAWDAIKEYTNILVEFWTGIFSGDGGIGSSIMNAFQSIIDVALPILLDAFDFIKDMLTQLKTFWDENGASIVEAVKIAFQYISQQIQEVMNFLQPFIQAAWEVIKVIIETAMGVIQGVIKVVTGLIRGDWSQVWEGIKQIFSSVWDGIESIVDTAINSVKSIISNTWNAIKSITSSVWEGIKSAITTPIEAAKAKVQSVVNSVKNILISLGDIDLFSAGRAIVDGFLSGLTSAFESVKSTVGGWANWIKEHKGPISYDKRLLIGNGKAIVYGLNKGLKSEFNTVKSTVYGLTNLITTGADKINTELSNFDINIPQMNDMALAYSSSSNSQFNGDYDYSSKIEVHTEVISKMDSQKVGYGVSDYVSEANDKKNKKLKEVYG